MKDFKLAPGAHTEIRNDRPEIVLPLDYPRADGTSEELNSFPCETSCLSVVQSADPNAPTSGPMCIWALSLQGVGVYVNLTPDMIERTIRALGIIKEIITDPTSFEAMKGGVN